MRTALRRTTTMVLLMTAAALATGCAESGGGESGGGEAAASCAYLFTYENRTYVGPDNVEFTVGEKLGTATSVPCDDTPNDGDDGEPARQSTAYAVEGKGTDVAIAVGDSPDDVQYMRVHNPVHTP